MNKLLLSVLGFLTMTLSTNVVAQEKEKQLVIENRLNNPKQVDKPYVILISIDGFRHDYIEKYNAEFLKSLGEQGVRAESMLPSYPSVTFPNHYTIVTGLYPAHHGLVGNNIYDPKMDARYSLGNAKAVRNKDWYGGTPLWVLAEQQEMLSACYYWPGSEADIKGVLPSYYYKYSEKTPMQDRIGEVVNWLSLPEDQRPHFITFYLPEVDHAGHRYGPDAPETEAAVKFADESIKQLVSEVSKTGLPVNYIVVSDHGMVELNQKKLLKFPIKLTGEDFKITRNGTYVSVFVNDKSKIDYWYNKISSAANKKYMKVYKHDELPESYNFGGEHDRFGRVGDIVVTAESPYYFTDRKLAGSHGFDPKTVKEMHAIFLAYGPQIKSNKVIPSFENVHVYPIVTEILGLEVTEDIDGNTEVAKQVLK
ncbi:MULTISPECIES: ectonucleotide pyrophosphatase/phosphodiesterase [Myroides]|uniref:Alkaline phosphatase family protein n=1 Tax=Myroides albus TaxID=2562892 RepID=A0A6I3LKD2_9FLAO|nr:MULTISPECIES: ectonucleotide pyrophosphatase/phosphodiesterase [Myroides]MTG96612.1 alkaline phosphatase family protein [Myroides albus]MVX34608.1 alkaline phosphatase family protein [Myroides sp. LoEW2-1]UVD80975.1 ectonucleotide pyrophosphatase/phosphodiesterase [Myroides albus]